MYPMYPFKTILKLQCTETSKGFRERNNPYYFWMDDLPNFSIHFYRSTAGAKKDAKIRTVHAKERQTIAPWSVNV